MSHESAGAARDLQFIRTVLERAQKRIDPHAFHFVHWGWIVLIWYPLGNWFEYSGEPGRQIPLGIAALVIGALLSVRREMLLARRPRLEGENTFIGGQVGWIVGGCIGAGMLLSAVAPATDFVRGADVPVLWGLVYAALAYMTGVVYRREFLASGVSIFCAALAAMAYPQFDGFILGPAMGFGLAIPGWIAERRVRRMQEEVVADAAAAIR